MTNHANRPINTFTISDAVVEAAQKALDTKIAEKANDWIVEQTDDLIEIWRSEENESKASCKFVKSAIDLKCLAESLGRENLVIVASSLYAFVETARPLNKTAIKLVDLHIEAIQALTRLNLSGQQDDQLPKQVVEELRSAAIKVARV